MKCLEQFWGILPVFLRCSEERCDVEEETEAMRN